TAPNSDTTATSEHSVFIGYLHKIDAEHPAARRGQPSASWARRGPNRSLSLRGRRLSERRRELRARVDPELAVDARQVHLDRSLGDEEGLRDLSVGRPRRRQLGDASLAGRQRLDAA